ncbi:MAG: hypothetical protein RL141_229 [Candidatus Parcubacteria bacterium]|jgi:uncharacterized membrane protein
MNWILFALIAPFFWTASNFVDKYVLEKYTKGIVDFLFFSSIASWFLFFVLLPFVGMPALNLYAFLPIITGMILVYSYGFYAKALGQGDTSSLVILFNLIPVVTVILAFVFLGQTLSPNELLGLCVVLIGATMISLEKTKNIFIKGLGMILVAIFIWSVMYLIVDYGLTKMSYWDYLLLDSLGSALAAPTFFIIPSMRRRLIGRIKQASMKKYFWVSCNGLLDFFGHMSVKQALALVPSAGLVTTVTQTQSFYTIALGVLLTLLVPKIIKENITIPRLLKKTIGAVIMFTGVYILLV